MAQKKKRLAGEGARLVATTVAGQLVGPGGTLAVRLLDSAAQWHQERGRRRAEQFVQEFLESGHPGETAKVDLEAMLSNPTLPLKNVIIDSIRQMDDLVSDEVIPALALLTREYVRADRPKDRFYASVVRVLRNLEEGEFGHLQRLVAAVTQTLPHPDTGLFHISMVVGEEKGRAHLWGSSDVELVWEEHFSVLMRSLVANELATIAAGPLRRLNDKEGWLAETRAWARLAAVLGVS